MRLTEALRLPTVGVHLAIFVEPYLSAVLDGRKTIESRFGVQKRPPYLCVSDGDILVLKRSGGPVVGLARAQAAHFYQLSPSILADLRHRFAFRLFAFDEEFWVAQAGKQFATLIEISDPLEISPMSLDKRDRRGWVTFSSANATELKFGF